MVPFPLKLSKADVMSTLYLGDTVPDFEQDTSIGRIRFHEWAGASWVVLFSHPADFTPVCTTELGLTGKLQPEFEKRNVQAIAISVDDVESHRTWAKDIEDTQKTVVGFPIIADNDKSVATLYDMIHPNQSGTATVRAVFIIDPAKKLRLTLTYPLSIGRNFDEILRVIDALQLSDAYGVATPGNWRDGDDVIIPLSLQDETLIREKFSKRISRGAPLPTLHPSTQQISCQCGPPRLTKTQPPRRLHTGAGRSLNGAAR
jgi:alkyl hydroperoxide reductase subunit AhpC